MTISQPGAFLLNKASGISSARAIAGLKSKLKLKKIGHCGTLDPAASGLLVCLVNSATRLAPWIVSGAKVYSGIIRLGITTSSDDLEGEVLSAFNLSNLPSDGEIKNVLAQFIGPISQIPPKISAVKIKGKPSYKRVRAGEQVELKPRNVQIHSFEVEPVSDSNLAFRISCSAGTYIRSVARDLGQVLGCGACLASLKREESAPFSLEQAKKLNDIEPSDMLPLGSIFPDSDQLGIESSLATRLRSGDQNALEQISGLGQYQHRKEVSKSCPKILYFDSKHPQQLLGMLEHKNDKWNIAVNF